MVPGASKRNVLVALAYLLLGLLAVGLVSDSGTALLSLPGAQAPV
jgi:16S rRNA C1402 (ribose-2'-O) methylase RsmI